MVSGELLTPKKIAKVCNEAISEKWDKDITIAITGYEGSGKSTLAIKIAKNGQWMLGLPFDYFKTIIYTMSPKEILEKIKDEQTKYFIFDEAIKQFYKMEFGTSHVRELTKIFTIIRKLNNVYIFNIPRIHDLTEYFRNHRIQIWIHVFHRPPNDVQFYASDFHNWMWRYKFGWGAVLCADQNPFFRDPWHIERIQAMIKKMTKTGFNLLSLSSKIRFFRKYAKDNFVGFVLFTRLTSSEYDKYKKFNLNFSVSDIVEDKTTPFTIMKYLKALKILRRLGLSTPTICSLLDISKSQLKEIRKMMKKVDVSFERGQLRYLISKRKSLLKEAEEKLPTMHKTAWEFLKELEHQ